MNWPQIRGGSHFVFLHKEDRKKGQNPSIFISYNLHSFGIFPGLPSSPGLGEKVDSCMITEGICQVGGNRRVELKILPRTVK